MDHPPFDTTSLSQWIQSKIAIDQQPGCLVRAILADKELAGWCGIQPEGSTPELAIVIAAKFRGLGKLVFKDLMQWARELGHPQVEIHLLNTRREYRFLRRMAETVTQNELGGYSFTTYLLNTSPENHHQAS